jgi:hypothetical protein
MFIDFDLTYHRWRILTQANATMGEMLIGNGTWANTTLFNPHATFPELNLQAPNLYFFRQELPLPALPVGVQN